MSALDRVRAQKDDFFQHDWQSPLEADQRPDFTGLKYYPENSALRFTRPIEPHADQEIVTMINEIVTIRDNYNFQTEVLIAAVRNARQIVESALAGADIVTAGFSVFQEGFQHPYTDNGLAKFQSFWDRTQYE